MPRLTVPLALALATLLISTACAGRRLRHEATVALAAADTRVLDGCYHCLLEARRTYESLAASKHVNADSVTRRLFETDILLTLRAKELQLDWHPAFERAKQSAANAGIRDADRLLAAVDAVLPDNSGRMNDWPVAMRRERAGFIERVPDEVAFISSSALSPHVRRYVALSVDCSHDARVLAPHAQPGAAQRRPVLEADSPPLLIYRTGICLSADTNMLAAAMAVVPAFHEAAYFAAIPAAFRAQEDGGSAAAALLARAYEHFPSAPGVPYHSGWLFMSLGDCDSAKRWFAETVAIDPAHELALLQGTICHSRTHDDSAAIDWATRLIALGTGLAQQGYYWRAVSRFRQRTLASARADVDTAKLLEREANALTLAGIIENEQGELTLAESDLREARALPQGTLNCTATWTLALVIGKSHRPAEAADMFENAMWCYDVRVADLRGRIERLRRLPPSNTAFARRRVDRLAADTADLRTRYFASAFNAAGHRANAGRIDLAHELLAVAARDTNLAGPIAKLREAIALAK